MRYADSAADLQICMKTWPDALPSAFLRDDGPASHYYDVCTLWELRSFLNGDPDLKICDRFGLGPGEWREAVEMALMARLAVQRRRAS